jgi:plasmid stabilization system protein ParE
MNIVILPDAEMHLNNIYDFIKVKSEKSAINLYNNILDEIERLRFFPQIAAIESILSDFPETFRSLVVKKTYKVIYFVKNETIYIVAIWDCRQNPNTLYLEF